MGIRGTVLRVNSDEIGGVTVVVPEVETRPSRDDGVRLANHGPVEDGLADQRRATCRVSGPE